MFNRILKEIVENSATHASKISGTITVLRAALLPNSMKTGKNIIRLREEKKITRKELSCKAKVSESHLREIEHNNKKASMRTLARIADVLEVSLSELIGKSGNES